MPPPTSAYAGQRAVLATRHGKLVCVAPPLRASTGLVVDAVDVDTDALGTFSRETPRTAPPLETAVAKARLGIEASGTPLGLASEGSFGAHPTVPWGVLDREIVVFVDQRSGLVVAGVAASAATRTVTGTVRPGDDLQRLLADADLPRHAVVVTPNAGPPRAVRKGLRRPGEVATAVSACAALSEDGAARVETDLRAHVCPSRRDVIGAAARDLATRLATTCPSCGSPGLGRSGVVPGVPCRWCGAATDLVRAEVLGCPACDHRRERPVVPEGATADPGRCPRCNP